MPTLKPTDKPTFVPNFLPTLKPTDKPTFVPTYGPTLKPFDKPTFGPTFGPTLKQTTLTILPTHIGIITVVASNESGSIFIKYIIAVSSVAICFICVCFIFYYYRSRTNKNSNTNTDELYQMNSDGDMVNNRWYNMYDFVDIYKNITSKKNGSYNDIEQSISIPQEDIGEPSEEVHEDAHEETEIIVKKRNHKFSRINSLLLRKEMIKKLTPQYVEEDPEEEGQTIDDIIIEDRDFQQNMSVTPRLDGLKVDPFASIKEQRMPIRTSLKISDKDKLSRRSSLTKW